MFSVNINCQVTNACATLPANESIVLHYVGTYKYSGTTTIAHAELAPAKTQVQNQAILTRRALATVGIINIRMLSSCIEDPDINS
jgi:hypothetical protein